MIKTNRLIFLIFNPDYALESTAQIKLVVIAALCLGYLHWFNVFQYASLNNNRNALHLQRFLLARYDPNA